MSVGEAGRSDERPQLRRAQRTTDYGQRTKDPGQGLSHFIDCPEWLCYVDLNGDEVEFPANEEVNWKRLYWCFKRL